MERWFVILGQLSPFKQTPPGETYRLFWLMAIQMKLMAGILNGNMSTSIVKLREPVAGVTTDWFQIRCYCGEKFLSEGEWINHQIMNSKCASDCHGNITVTLQRQLTQISVPADNDIPAVHLKSTGNMTSMVATDMKKKVKSEYDPYEFRSGNVSEGKHVVPRSVQFVCDCGEVFDNIDEWRSHKQRVHVQNTVK